MEVRAVVSMYEARGELQLGVEAMRRAGLGNLYEAFLRLKEKLSQAGLFDAERKRSIPTHPRAIGVITSLQAAAMRTAPSDPDGASGLYVAGFQVGIMAGSLAGGLLYERAGLALMMAASTALVVVALTGVTATRGLLEVPQGIGRK